MLAHLLVLLLSQNPANMGTASVAVVGGKLRLGQACSLATQCASGFCNDSVCCDQQCTSACDACSVAAGASVNGTCATVSAGSAGNPVCSPYFCDGSQTICPGTCTLDAHCSAGNYCIGGACKDYYFGMLASTNLGTMDNAFCTTYASEMTGTYWCLDGTGSNSTGAAFTTAGSPTALSLPMCPNGTDCNTYSQVKLSTTSDYFNTSSGMTTPAGDFSICYFGSVKTVGAEHMLIAKDRQQATAKHSFYMEVSAANQLEFKVYKAGGSSSVFQFNFSTIDGEHLWCATYDYVADGTSVMTVYVDGYALTPVTNAVGPPDTTSGITGYVGRRDGTTNTAHNTGAVMRWALFTEKVLSASTIQAMSNSLRPYLKGTNGESVDWHLVGGAHGRAGTGSCPNAAGTGWANLGYVQYCINGNGLISYPARTNIGGTSQQLATWSTGSGSITKTADTTLGPDGTTTADTIQATTNGAYITSPTWTPGQTTATMSLWAKTASGTQSFQIGAYQGGVTLRGKCDLTATTTWTRYLCGATGMTGGSSHIMQLLPGNGGTGTVIATDFQVEAAGATLGTSNILTPTSSSVSRLDDDTMWTPTKNTSTEGCLAATVTFDPFNVPSNGCVLGNGTECMMRADSATVMSVNDGTNSVTATVSSVLGRAINIRTWWRAGNSSMGITADGVSSSGSFDGSMTNGLLYFGMLASGSGYLPGSAIKNIKVGDRYDGCQL